MSPVAHVDLDCFYAAVERERDQTLRGVPLCVCQYSPGAPGGVADTPPEADRRLASGNHGLIAVSYEARAQGVTRHMRSFEARKLCPSLVCIQVPTSHGKADLQIYRTAGASVLQTLARRADAVERASIDECYLDLQTVAAEIASTRPWKELLAAAVDTHVAGVSDHAAWLARDASCWTAEERLLLAGAVHVAEARAEVHRALGYTTSAGIAVNKLMAKVGSGLHKPASQTLVPPSSTLSLLDSLALSRLRGLGGALGERISAELHVHTAGELAAIPHARLAACVGEDAAHAALRLARGESDDIVKSRPVANQIGCSKTFRGALALKTERAVEHWLAELAGELDERLSEDAATSQRSARSLTVSFCAGGRSLTRSCPLRPPAARVAADAAAAIRKYTAGLPANDAWPITSLGLSAGSFEATEASGSLAKLWSASPAKAPAASAVEDMGRSKQRQTLSRPPPSSSIRAHFQPSFTPAGDTAQCSRCGAAVAIAVASEHADWHYARDLSREESEAQRAQTKRPHAAVSGPLDRWRTEGR